MYINPQKSRLHQDQYPSYGPSWHRCVTFAQHCAAATAIGLTWCRGFLPRRHHHNGAVCNQWCWGRSWSQGWWISMSIFLDITEVWWSSLEVWSFKRGQSDPYINDFRQHSSFLGGEAMDSRDKGWNNSQLATSMHVRLLVFHARCKAVQQFFAYAPPLLLCTALRLVKGRNIMKYLEGQERWWWCWWWWWSWPKGKVEHGKEWLWDIRIVIVKPAPWKTTQLHWIILRRNVLDQQIQEKPTSYKVFRGGELFWFVFWSDSAAASWDHRFLPHSSIGSLCNHAVSRAAADEVGNGNDVWEMAHSLPLHCTWSMDWFAEECLCLGLGEVESNCSWMQFAEITGVILCMNKARDKLTQAEEKGQLINSKILKPIWSIW